MPPGEPTEYIAKNSFIEGTRETGLDDLTREGGFLMSDLRTAVQNVNTTITRLNEQALAPENMQNIRASVEQLSAATAALAESSKKIDSVIDKADATMGSAKKAADDVQTAMTDARKTIQAATQAIHVAQHGIGDDDVIQARIHGGTSLVTAQGDIAPYLPIVNIDHDNQYMT